MCEILRRNFKQWIRKWHTTLWNTFVLHPVVKCGLLVVFWVQ